MEQIIKRNLAGNITAYHRTEGIVNPAITQASAIVYDAFGSILADSAVVEIETDGMMSCFISPELTKENRDWCRVHFLYDVDGEQKSQDVYFHIAGSTFDIPFYWEDLLVSAPFLKNRIAVDDDTGKRTRKAALNTLYSRLTNAGRRPWKIINLSSLSTAFTHLWLSLLCENLSTTSEDIWSSRSDEYLKHFEDEFARLNIIESEDNNADNSNPAPMSRTRIRRA